MEIVDAVVKGGNYLWGFFGLGLGGMFFAFYW
jgi:hypothetical protein